MSSKAGKKKSTRKRHAVFIDPQYSKRKVFICDFDHSRKNVPQPDFKNLNKRKGEQPVVRMHEEELKDDDIGRSSYRRTRKVEFQTVLYDAAHYREVEGSELQSCDAHVAVPRAKNSSSDAAVPEVVFEKGQIVNYFAKAKDAHGVPIRRKHRAEIKTVKGDGKYGIRYNRHKWEGKATNAHSKYLLFQPKKDYRTRTAYLSVIPVNGLRYFKREMPHEPKSFDASTYEPPAGKRTLMRRVGKGRSSDKKDFEAEKKPSRAGIFRSNEYDILHSSDEDPYEDKERRNFRLETKLVGNEMKRRERVNKADRTADYERIHSDDSEGQLAEPDDGANDFSAADDNTDSDIESEDSALSNSQDDVPKSEDNEYIDDDITDEPTPRPKPATHGAPVALPPSPVTPQETLDDIIIRIMETNNERMSQKDLNKSLKQEFKKKLKQKHFIKQIRDVIRRLCVKKKDGMLTLKR